MPFFRHALLHTLTLLHYAYAAAAPLLMLRYCRFLRFTMIPAYLCRFAYALLARARAARAVYGESAYYITAIDYASFRARFFYAHTLMLMLAAAITLR